MTASLAAGDDRALGGTTSVASDAAGVATFSNLTIAGGLGRPCWRCQRPDFRRSLPTIMLAPATPATLAPDGPVLLTGVAGNLLASPPAVIAKDAAGNPVTGVRMTPTAEPGAASITPGTATTDSEGRALLDEWRLPPTTGTYSINAVSPDIPGSLVRFTAEATFGVASHLVLVSGDGGTGVVGGTSAPLVARVVDTNGNAVAIAGLSVAWSVPAGGGTLISATTVTDVNGVTQNSLTLPTQPRTTTVTAELANSGSAVSFSVVVTAGPPAAIIAVTSTSMSVPAGAIVTPNPTVRVTDSFGNGLAAVAVSFTTPQGGGTVTGGTTVTDASGFAAVGSWTLPSIPGAYTLTAAAAGVGPTVSFTATANSDTRVRWTSGTPRSPSPIPSCRMH